MSFMGGSGGGSQPIPLQIPTKSTEEVQAAAAQTRARLAAANGRSSTILTGVQSTPSGTNSTAPRAILLGA